MKLDAFIAALQDVRREGGGDLNVELSRVFAIRAEAGEAFEIQLDFPIIGMAQRDDDLMLLVEEAPALARFGKVTRLGGDDDGN